MRVLMVTNGNGEMAIADRIAEEMHALAPTWNIDHLALVGDVASEHMRDVGPRARMPSGGLIAMGNLGNIARDLCGGLLGLTLAQRRFLTAARGHYDYAVAVGDTFALLMALAARVPTTYVGTAKSVAVAPYGPMERRVLRRAQHVFVRDEATARVLRGQGLGAQAPGNVIVDLFARADDPRANEAVAGFDLALALLPGSRDAAYEDGRFLVEVVRELARARPHLGAVLSIAPQLDAARFEARFSPAWRVETQQTAPITFALFEGGRAVVRGWSGALGPLLSRVQLVIGQAGTANEAAAAAGIPIVAFERGNDRKTAWYRRRQSGLLGDALLVLPGGMSEAVAGVAALLDDPERRARMGEAGREHMGASGGARRIADAIVSSTT
ncbi:MAG TPA: hypothetical protein VGN11_07300 [Candidatus Baltobacteraceae bacterium]|jgi:uncharacterized protein (TIGR03492 family)|nr:hypothetical protein [Candidatus Baltobacteraceae bacterium]